MRVILQTQKFYNQTENKNYKNNFTFGNNLIIEPGNHRKKGLFSSLFDMMSDVVEGVAEIFTSKPEEATTVNTNTTTSINTTTVVKPQTTTEVKPTVSKQKTTYSSSYYNSSSYYTSYSEAEEIERKARIAEKRRRRQEKLNNLRLEVDILIDKYNSISPKPMTKTSLKNYNITELNQLIKEIRQETMIVEERITINNLLVTLKKVTGKTLQVKSTDNLTLEEIKAVRQEVETTVNEEIEHEKMMQKLEGTFRKGAAHYLPAGFSALYPGLLEDIRPFRYEKMSSENYKSEIKMMCEAYLRNSAVMDRAATTFDSLTHNYFTSAAQSMKEIFNIGSETRLLEMIPKLGIIPKALRIVDQIRLTKCVEDDYNDVTNFLVNENYLPLVNKYNTQLDVIKNFVKENRLKSMKHPIFTNKYLKKVEEARSNRANLSIKLIENYAKLGKNISNVFKGVKKSGVVDLVKKTIVTFIV